MNTVKVLAPAKLNLALDVVGVLPNGYHDLDMIMQTVDLYETIILRKSQNLTLTLPGSRVPAGATNTAYKAALAFFHYTGLLAGVDMEIRKAVPVRAGMAGGSADAAGVLVGLNALYGAKLSMSELCAIGAGIGADVPFALVGGTCRVKGVGDLIKALPPMPECWFVVVMPSFGISTPEAFAKYDQVGARSILTVLPRNRPSVRETWQGFAALSEMRWRNAAAQWKPLISGKSWTGPGRWPAA